MKFFLFFLLLSCSLSRPFPQIHKNWNYQLQNYQKASPKRFYNSYLVIDSFNDQGIPFTKNFIQELKKQNNTVFSYLSIGEAESYRPYYKQMDKKLLLKENKNWQGNFTVQYWKEKWHALILDYLDQIISQGFDGVYLDIIDAFHRFPDKKEKAELMAQLIIKISKRAKKRNSQFYIILQNGIDIIHNLKSTKSLLQNVDGISIEAQYFLYSSDQHKPTQIAHLDQLEKTISIYRNEHKLILGVEYGASQNQARSYFSWAKKIGLLPLITNYGLKGY